MNKKKVKIKKILRVCPGGFHAWVESNVGIIRKPLNKIKVLKGIMTKIIFKPIDIIAIITIIGAFVLIAFGFNGTVGLILTTVVLAYFGKKELLDPLKEKKLPEAKTETVEQIIRRIAKQEGVDPDLALRVARCESGLNPAAKNVNTNKTIDRGVFQWNDKWHPEISDGCAYDTERATRAFCKAFKEGHLDWWNATKKCWDI